MEKYCRKCVQAYGDDFHIRAKVYFFDILDKLNITECLKYKKGRQQFLISSFYLACCIILFTNNQTLNLSIFQVA